MSISQTQNVCIRISEQCESRSRQIAQFFGLPQVDNFEDAPYDYGLNFHQGRLKLFDLNFPKYRPIYMKINQVQQMSRKSLLGRAIGKKTKTIVDATAGLGGDSLLLARMGFNVTAIERSPVFAALLADGVSKLNSMACHLSIQHCFGDAKLILPNQPDQPDAVYLDPMFPLGRKRSVKVARPLAVLREITEDDVDSEELLQAALESALKKVVVKRPNFADSICPDQISMKMQGKLVRYDIYQVNG